MPINSHSYAPLDLESSSFGFRTIEQHEALSKKPEPSTRRRVLIGCSLAGAVLAALVAAFFLAGGPELLHASGSSSSSSHGSADSSGLWNEGGSHVAVDDGMQQGSAGFVPCVGSSLRCSVVNKLPLPDADFRGLPRTATSSRGMVAADSSRCSQIGRDVLAHGGNAADAAVAVALCLGVVNPVSSGLGGGAFITARLANGSALFIDARETAPGAANATMYAGLPSNASLDGGLAVAVPCELHGLAELWRRHGSVPWAQLVRPAAELARSGFAAHPYLVYVLSGPGNRRKIESSPALREAFMVQASNGSWRLPQIGELCCQRPQLADTLTAIAERGPSYLSSAAVAATMAQELQAAGGIISAEDLAAAAPVVREPLRVQLGELELLVPPPPSSAAVVAFALKFLASYNNTMLGSSGGGGGGASKQVLPSFGGGAIKDGGLGMHRLVEAQKHGFAVRTALGDPGTPSAPTKLADSINAATRDLLDDGFVAEMRGMTQDDGVLPPEQYGGIWNPRGVTPPEEHGTTHFSVVDAQHNAVSVTSSVNTAFGSGVVSASTGILFGNTMDDFAQPNKSSIVTPHPSAANFIEPGKRPLSAMSPIIVTHKSGRLVAVTGASGGPLIVSATLQTLARLLLEGASLRDAVLSPRVHDQLLPRDATYYESYTWGRTHHQLDSQLVRLLQARGQSPVPGGFSLGVSQAVFVQHSSSSSSSSGGGVLVGQSDSRKDGAPAGL